MYVKQKGMAKAELRKLVARPFCLIWMNTVFVIQKTMYIIGSKICLK